MANLIAIDWDSHELRAVTGRSGSGSFTVTDTATVPLGGDDSAVVATALADLLRKLGAGKGKYKLLVAIGRGKAELRQLTLPPVPANELPGMVRFQALQSFSNSGDTVAVDYLPIEVSETSTSVIAAGVAPATMKQIEQIATAVSLELKRVVLRPVAAAALFSMKARSDAKAEGDCVLVDLLADDAEIVVFRKGKMIFVRSVRMPEQTQGRTSQIAGEIRRSLMACGTDAATGVQRVVIWGQAKTHQADTQQLRDLLHCEVETLDPLELVDVDSRRSAESDYAAGGHTGRLAPLIGVLVADSASESTDGQSAVLVDFLNPRKAAEVQSDNRRRIGIAAAVATVLLLLVVTAWWSLSSGTAQVAARQAELNELRPQVTRAEESLAKTERVDQFLDAGVVWLDEFRRLADRMPPSDQAILKSVTATSLPREGGGKLALAGAATSPTVVDEMESALRGDDHSVSGSGANDLGEKEAYRWGFTQSVFVLPEAVRRQRYAAYALGFDDSEQVDAGDTVSEDTVSEDTVSEDAATDAAADASPAADASTDPGTSTGAAASEAVSGEAAAVATTAEDASEGAAEQDAEREDAPINTVEPGGVEPEAPTAGSPIPTSDPTDEEATR